MKTQPHKYRYIYVSGEFRELPDWIYLTIETDPSTDTQKLYVHSRIHANKKVFMGCYTTNFTADKVIDEASMRIRLRFDVFSKQIWV